MISRSVLKSIMLSVTIVLSACSNNPDHRLSDPRYFYLNHLDGLHPTVFPDFNIPIDFFNSDGDMLKLRSKPQSQKFIMFSLLQKIDDTWYLVLGWEYDFKAPSFIGLGCISTTTPLYVRLESPYDHNKGYSKDDILYESPDYSSPGIYLPLKRFKPVRVTDVSSRWLKVEFSHNGKSYQGWVPPEIQYGLPVVIGE